MKSMKLKRRYKCNYLFRKKQIVLVNTTSNGDSAALALVMVVQNKEHRKCLSKANGQQFPGAE